MVWDAIVLIMTSLQCGKVHCPISVIWQSLCIEIPIINSWRSWDRLTHYIYEGVVSIKVIFGCLLSLFVEKFVRIITKLHSITGGLKLSDLKAQYIGRTSLTPRLPIPWFLASPMHQQPRHWLFRITESLSSTRKDFDHMRLFTVTKW